MTQPLFFDPLSDYPDAHALGIGDLIYPDGRREFLNGDPELAGSLPPYQGGMQLDMPQIGQDVGYQPQQPLLEPGSYSPEELAGPPPTIQGADGRSWKVTPQGLEPVNSLQLENPEPPKPRDGQQDDMGITAVGANQPTVSQTRVGATNSLTPGAESPLLEPGKYTPEQLAGPPPVIQTAKGPMQVTPQGFQPYQREGALPPELAAEQLGQLGAQQQATLQATEQARADQVRLTNEYTAQRMAEDEAEKARQEQEIAEQQAKIERFNEERRQLADMNIETDLVSARGPIGAALGIAGATLLSAVGNDAGLRMIDKAIDTNVREQVRRRDTKLGILADQIGSSEQAIKMGKARLYDVLADRLGVMAQKTQNDIYEAQTPAIIESLRQKSLVEMQEAQKISLGKLTERMPTPPKPPSEALMQKYGELRRDRDAASGMVQRVEQQVGLRWQPGRNGQPGHYQNRAEVLKRGIQGIGELEQWLPDFVYSTLGQQEGVQVRGAAQALAYAQIRQMQPTGPISNADIQAAVKAGALETEEGMIRGLERMRNSEEQQALNDQAQYGPNVVGEYERRYRASGGQTMGDLAPGRPAELQDKQRQIDIMRQQRQQQGAPRNTAADALQRQGISTEVQEMTPEQRMASLNESLTTLSQEKAIPPEGIAILMAQAGHETNDGKNMPTGNFFGMKSTPRNLARGAGATNLMTTEGAGGSAQRVKQNFATFDSAADAAMDMLSLLERKFPRALEALQAGDVDAYVAALRDGGYFTGDETSYLNGLKRRL